MIVLNDNLDTSADAADDSQVTAVHPTITGYRGLGDGARASVPFPPPWSQRLHHVVIASLTTSFLALIMTIATRSWGVGLNSPMSAGIFEVCMQLDRGQRCVGWGEYCPPASASMAAVRAASILALLFAIAMLACDAHEMMRPATFRIHQHTMTVCSHLMWLFLLVAWTVCAGAFSTDCGDTPYYHASYTPSTQMWFGWGWFFMLLMWVVIVCLAVLLTSKMFKLTWMSMCGL